VRRPVKWGPWVWEGSGGSLPSRVRRGCSRSDKRTVEIYMSRGDEGRFCRTWHVGISIDGVLVFQSGMHTAQNKRDAEQDLIHKAYQWLAK